MTKQNQTITVNRLPAKTWNWLKMNETVIGMPRIDGSIAIKQSVAEAGQAEAEQLRMAQQTDWDKITTGMGEAMDQPSEADAASMSGAPHRSISSSTSTPGASSVMRPVRRG